nr:hypothetical protein [Tanacetum cinerariifolium]
MKYLPQSIWRKSDKDKAAAMIQAIDKRLKTRRIIRSMERSILTDLQVTLTKPGRMTKPYSSHRFIANCFNSRNLKMEVKLWKTLLTSSFTVSPIPITRVHRDPHVSQIIGDVSSAPLTRSMTRMVTHQDVKSAFLYGTIEEEVYVCQHLGFEDPDYPDKVYKVVKALCGLHQAPRAWYEILANYLLENGFQRRKINQTLFIKREKGNILLVQIYVDDIIFGSTNKDLCKAFEKLIKDMFQMSSMGELTFFLDGKSASTPIDTEKPLLKDPDGEDVDVHTYRSMIGSLMYLTSSRPDIMFAVCACAHFQVTHKALHLHAVKRIFRYLKGKPHLGLWYPKDSPFNLVAYSDSDYAGASLDRKSTTGGCQFLGCRLIFWQCKKQTVIATSSTEADLSMASAVICLVIGRKFNFSKYIFDSLVRNVDSSSKFYMCPRFLQLMIHAQVSDLSSHTTKYPSPNLTQKVFANMRRVGKGFSWVETPLFEGMIVPQQAADVADEVVAGVDVDNVVAEDAAEPTLPSPTATTQPPPPSQELPSTS